MNILEIIEKLEYFIIINSKDSILNLFDQINNKNEKINLIFELSMDLISGNYFKILKNSFIENKLEKIMIKKQNFPFNLNLIINKQEQTNNSEEIEDTENQFLIILGGIACLYCFIQENWTGPHYEEIEIPLV